MNSQRLAFVDWMKCLGMALIVLGHTGGERVLGPITHPFNPKQLGVAFFVFVAGFSLAGETRRPGRVVYNRLFELYFYGLLVAMAISCIMLATVGDAAESNFLPFLLGANVLLNNFPANPTTWYIGTYLHLLLFWALFARRLTVAPWMLLVAAVVEATLRAALMARVGDHMAYMVVTSWLTVFLMGQYYGQKKDGNAPHELVKLVGFALCLAGVCLGWSLAARASGLTSENPFGRAPLGDPWAAAFATSACVTLLYATYTWLTFQTTRRLGDVPLVRFLAENTILVFLVHMPLIFALAPSINRLIPAGWLRAGVNLFVFYGALAIVSAGVRRITQPRAVRDWLAEKAMFVVTRVRPGLLKSPTMEEIAVSAKGPSA